MPARTASREPTSEGPARSARREAIILDKALTWFIYVWVCLIALFNVIAIIGFVLVAPTLWAELGKIQETYSPFNVWNWLAEVISLSPALGAMVWRDRRRNRTLARIRTLSNERQTK